MTPGSLLPMWDSPDHQTQISRGLHPLSVPPPCAHHPPRGSNPSSPLSLITLSEVGPKLSPHGQAAPSHGTLCPGVAVTCAEVCDLCIRLSPPRTLGLRLGGYPPALTSELPGSFRFLCLCRSSFLLGSDFLFPPYLCPTDSSFFFKDPSHMLPPL